MGRPSAWRPLEGLSPRGRSHPRAISLSSLRSRSISAWAESSTCRSRAFPRRRVYLRVGGVITATGWGTPTFSGLSPRGRSHPRRLEAVGVATGSISAWAESSAGASSSRKRKRVYLRVGGVIIGPTPCTPRARGLSPRGRSHRLRDVPERVQQRSISAWAESSAMSVSIADQERVYLRVGGVIQAKEDQWHEPSGLSPRGRSHLRLRARAFLEPRSISAWAESSLTAPPGRASGRVYLRVGGVIDEGNYTYPNAKGLSPRGRSHPFDLNVFVPIARSISAWAESSTD